MPLICFIMGHIAMESLPACMCSIMWPISWLSPSSRSSAHTRGSGGPIPHSLKERGGETGATPWAHASQIREPLRCRVVEDNYRSARSSPHDMRGTRRWTTAGREVPLDRPGERQTAARPLTKCQTKEITATTSNAWINPPATWNRAQPKIQQTRNTKNRVRNMMPPVTFRRRRLVADPATNRRP